MTSTMGVIDIYYGCNTIASLLWFGHADLRCGLSHFSPQFIKKNCNFLAELRLEPGSPDSETSALLTTPWDSDGGSSFCGIWYSSVTPQFIYIAAPKKSQKREKLKLAKAGWPLKGRDNNLKYEIIAKSSIFFIVFAIPLLDRNHQSNGYDLWRL